MKNEIKAAKIGDLKDGQMKEVVVDDAKILLARVKGKFHAIGGVCTHYGGPLAEGALNGERVVCPWHQASFNVATGDLLEPPALDAQPLFEVRVNGDDVLITVPEKPEDRRTPSMVKRHPAESRTFAILGAGAAGNAAAETLRQDGFGGRLVLITQEQRIPYDRPNLSKGYLSGEAGPESLPWRTEDFYRDHDIELAMGRRVSRVDIPKKTIAFADGSSLSCDALLLASGGTPRPLEVEGARLENVFTLRSPEDADQIIAAAGSASHAVTVGAGFIGLEAAASLTKRGLTVTVMGSGRIPFERQLGPELGRMLQQVHEEKGVSFRMGQRVARLKGDGRVQAVMLDNGEELKTDLVLVGIGVKPATEFLQGVELNADGSVTVDRYLSVTANVYAAGDIARFPDWRTGETIRVEHWRLAEQHGRVAAHNMAGKKTEFKGVPFFWTDHFDQTLQYVGYVTDWDDLIVHGDLAGRNFMAFYVKAGKVLAAAGLQHDRQLAAIAELMRLDRLPSPEQLRQDQGFDPVGRLWELQA